MQDATANHPTGKGGRQTVLAILGMHRSGTSLAAIAAQRLGAATGKDLLPGDEFNPDGYGEDVNVVRLHNSLLTAFGRPWNTLRGTFPLPADWIESAESERVRGELESYLRAEFSRVGGAVWALKDPRLSILVPLWSRLAHDLDFDFVPVLCIRSPDAVARSIEKRDGMPPGLGRLLWLQYNAAVVAETGDIIAAVLDYDGWFADPDANLAHLVRAAGLATSDSDRAAIASELVRPDYRHYEPSRAEGLCGRWQELFENWASAQRLPEALRDEVRSFKLHLDAFEPWLEALTQDNYTNRMMDALQRERDQLSEAADRNYRAYMDVDAQWTTAKMELERLERERDEVLAAAERNYQAYKDADAQFHAARAELVRLEQERDAVVEVANKHYQAYTDIDSQWRAAKEVISRLERELSETLETANRQYQVHSDTIKRLERELSETVAAANRNYQAYKEIDGYYNAMLRRFDRLPFSLFMPPDARAPASDADDSQSEPRGPAAKKPAEADTLE